LRTAEVKTALVTGAARGIGLATANALQKAGLRVLRLDVQGEIAYDLTNLAGIPKLVDSLGEIHVLVNNAGIQNAVPIGDYTEAQRKRIIAVNLEAPVELIRALSKQMIARREGRIVNLASIASWQPHPDLWYGITKAGVVSMTKSFASYLGRHGIQVNAVAPGPVDTELLQRIDPARREGLLKVVYSGRVGKPEEIAATIAWLATAAPPLINGAIVDINDGTYPRA
jgi:NAD(P)-dependent dehydrogenase (short-subunit alcohol dehydrogenase family)